MELSAWLFSPGCNSIYGGLKAVALTDVIQVVFLVAGGLVTTYIALDRLGEGSGVLQGMTNLYAEASDKFHLILDKSHPGYMDLPGMSVIFGGLWVANLYYWGCNQYIIQRALAAKSVREAQNGMLFAGFIKLFIPLLVVIPGIAAFALDAPLAKPDEAYPWLLSELLPVGIKGVAFAALTAAIVSSLASMMNSISTIFTMDIYRSFFRKEAGQRELVRTGRWASFVSLVIAMAIAPMLSGLDQAFQYIQEFTGFVSPGALAIFLAGFFYKRATANGALAAAVGSFLFSFGLKFLCPELPWMDRMGIVFLMCCALIVVMGKKELPDSGYTRHDPALFRTGKAFNSFVTGYPVDIDRLLLYLVVKNKKTSDDMKTTKNNLFRSRFAACFFTGAAAFAQMERLPDEAVYPLPEQLAGVKTPVLLLNGEWDFRYSSKSKWTDIQVPGEPAMQGYAIEHDKPFYI